MDDFKGLENKAKTIRKDVLKMLYEAGAGHPAGSLGMIEIFVSLYFSILNHDPKKPDWSERDRLIVSNGHVCPALYATLAHTGYFSVKELETLGKLGSRLQGHPLKNIEIGVENASGPLGCGLGHAAGIAYAARMDGKKFRIYCTTSDGEHNEGNHWESVMFTAKEKLSNLTMIVDRNNIQISGNTEEVSPLEPLKDKYESFNWHVLEVDGHNLEEIVDAANHANAISDKPTVIIAHTIPGKGVDFMEKNFKWHSKAPGMEELKKALEDVEEKV